MSKTTRERLDELAARFPHSIHPEGNLGAAILAHLEAAMREAEEGEWRRCHELIRDYIPSEFVSKNQNFSWGMETARVWLMANPPHPAPAVTEEQTEEYTGVVVVTWGR
jgi:hypothetical protein